MGVQQKKKNAARIANPAFDFNNWIWKLILIDFWFRIEIVTPLVNTRHDPALNLGWTLRGYVEPVFL